MIILLPDPIFFCFFAVCFLGGLPACIHWPKETHEQEFAVYKEKSSLTLNWLIRRQGAYALKNPDSLRHVGYRLYWAKSQDTMGQEFQLWCVLTLWRGGGGNE